MHSSLVGSPNSLPQLCINLTNEQLHNLFIEHVFKLEQQTYVAEEVEWQFVDYEDNQHVLDTIMKRPMCIFGQLDEACTNQAATDGSMLQNMHRAFEKTHRAYIKPKLNPDKSFSIHHYAGDVTYDIDGFVEKNKDALSADITALLEEATQWGQLKELALADRQRKEEADVPKPGAKAKGGGGKKKKTVGRSFGESLRSLHTKLSATEKHYIRCLKPNQTLKAGDWDGEFMFRQLAYSGTMEVTEIRKAGLNVRRPLKQFYMYYKICASDQRMLLMGETFTERTKLLLEQLPLDKAKYRVGKTIMFMALPEMLDELDAIREVKALEYIIALQALLRMVQKLQSYRFTRRALYRIQGAVKVKQIRLAYAEVRTAARFIQTFARAYLAHKLLTKLLEDNVLLVRQHKTPLTNEQIIRRLKRLLYPQESQEAESVSRATSTEAEAAKRPTFEARAHALIAFHEPGSPPPPPDGEAESGRQCWAVLRQGALSLYDASQRGVLVHSFDLAQCLVELDGMQTLLIYRNPTAQGWLSATATTTASNARASKKRAPHAAPVLAPAPPASDVLPTTPEETNDDDRMTRLSVAGDEDEVVHGGGGCFAFLGKARKKPHTPTRPPSCAAPAPSADEPHTEQPAALVVPKGRTSRWRESGGGAGSARQTRSSRWRESAGGGRQSRASSAAEDQLRAARAEGTRLVYLAHNHSGPLSGDAKHDGARQLLARLQQGSAEAVAADGFRLCLFRDEAQNVGMPVRDGVAPSIVMESFLWCRELDGRGAGTPSSLISAGAPSSYLSGRWLQHFVVLYDDGRLVRYTDADKAVTIGVVRLRHAMLEVLEPGDKGTNVAEAAAQGRRHGGTDLQKGDTVLGAGHVLTLVESRQVLIRSGANALALTSADAAVCNDWLAMLRTAQGAFLQLAPILPQHAISVRLPDKREVEICVTVSTRAIDVIQHVCSSHGISASLNEWALHEVWDHCGIPPGIARRRLPDTESLLDETILSWECSLRKRYGVVAEAPPGAFGLEMIKVSSPPLGGSAYKLDRLLEYMQAMRDVREGKVESEADVIDLCALALYVELNADELYGKTGSESAGEAVGGPPTAGGLDCQGDVGRGGELGGKGVQPSSSSGVRSYKTGGWDIIFKSLAPMASGADGRRNRTDRVAASWQAATAQMLASRQTAAREQEERMTMQQRMTMQHSGAAAAAGEHDTDDDGGSDERTGLFNRASVTVSDTVSARRQRRGSVSAKVGLRGSVVARRSQAFDTRSSTRVAVIGNQMVGGLLRNLLPSAWVARADEAQLLTWETAVVAAQEVLLHIDKQHDARACGELSPLRLLLYAQSLDAPDLTLLAAIRLVADFVRGLPGCFATEFITTLWLPPDEDDLMHGKLSGTEVPTVMSISKTTTELRLLPRAGKGSARSLSGDSGGGSGCGDAGSEGGVHRSGALSGEVALAQGELLEQLRNDELINWVPLSGLLVLNGTSSIGGSGQQARQRTKLHLMTSEAALATSLLRRYAEEKLQALHLEEKRDAVRRRQQAEAEAQRVAKAAARKPKTLATEARLANKKLQKAKSSGRESLVMDALESAGGSGAFTSRSIRQEMVDAPESSRRHHATAGDITERGGTTARGAGTDAPPRALLPRSQRLSAFKALSRETNAQRASNAVAAQLQQMRRKDPLNTEARSSQQQSTCMPLPGPLPVPQPDGWVTDRQVVEDHNHGGRSHERPYGAELGILEEEVDVEESEAAPKFSPPRLPPRPTADRAAAEAKVEVERARTAAETQAKATVLEARLDPTEVAAESAPKLSPPRLPPRPAADRAAAKPKIELEEQGPAPAADAFPARALPVEC